jgi:purine-binding chemotaxis protein CheW
MNQYLVFDIERGKFAINLFNVFEIIKTKKITRLPNKISWLEGMIDLRNCIIPIINFRVFFGYNDIKIGSKHRIIIVKLNNDDIIGFLVDSVDCVFNVSSDDIEDVSQTNSIINDKYVNGIIKKDDDLIVALDLDQLSKIQTQE